MGRWGDGEMGKIAKFQIPNSKFQIPNSQGLMTTDY